jgi:hypothetical protein
MRVYIAARYSRKDEIKLVRDRLERNHIEVTSSWLDEPHSPDTGLNGISSALSQDYAQKDLDDIDKSDTFLFFSERDLTPRGGRHVEFGYALAKNKNIVIIGDEENIFHFLPQVKLFSTVGFFLREVIND